jgi:hypothetical protein
LNRTATAANDESSATGNAKIESENAITATRGRPLWIHLVGSANGRDQFADERMIADTTSTPRIDPYNHPSGRHRRDGRCPVGNRRKRNGRSDVGIVQTQAPSQAKKRPAGSDPGAARRAWTA